MTLAERARNAESLATQGAAEDGRRERSLEDLRTEVNKRVPFESIARLMTENPERARNELRTACRAVLVDARWDGLNAAEKRQLTDELVDVVFGMGPIEGMIYDETITEIVVNGSKSIFFERDGRLVKSDLSFESDDQVRVLIDRIIGPLGRRIDESSPMVDARLPQGHRVNAVIAPVSLDGPLLTIRAFTRHVMTLEEMMACGSLGACERQYLAWVIEARKNLVVSGGTGSGKTTMLNALSCLIAHEERVVIIEDSAELKFGAHPHVVRMEARPRNAEGRGEVTIRDLVINALRMRPDRIIVGEVRGGEAFDMLMAMNTGHDGSLTTLHANSPEDVVERMVTMVRYAVDLPVDVIEAQMGSAFDCIVQVARRPNGARCVSQIAEVAFDRERRRCVVSDVFARDVRTGEGRWLMLPRLCDEVIERELVSAEEVARWKEQACLP